MFTEENEDKITILKCTGSGMYANKSFHVLGKSICKHSYSAGKYFEWEERVVTCLDDILKVLNDISSDRRKFVIRGQPINQNQRLIRRVCRGQGAAFKECGRKWVMFDLDKIPYPENLDIIQNPEDIVNFTKSILPEEFRDKRCVYKFSSSQNVGKTLDEKPLKLVSVHIWFWCDDFINNQQWKQYFKANPCAIDLAIFNPVQPHFTADPTFLGMHDPLLKRIGIC